MSATPANRALQDLFRTVAAGDSAGAIQLLATSPQLASASITVGATRAQSTPFFLDDIGRIVYAGDTALHIAAAAYDLAVVKVLLKLGAAVNAANRRGAQPLHSAAVGSPSSRRWNPTAQAKVIVHLIGAGADPNAVDRNGAAPLHRAVRTRCAGAVAVLLANGANPRQRNKSGSTPLHLAGLTTGRGGTGLPEAREQQAQIKALLEDALSVCPK